MDPDDVVAAGRSSRASRWVAVREFFDEYLDVMDAEGVLDYAELVHRSRILLADPDTIGLLRARSTASSWTSIKTLTLLKCGCAAIAGDGRDVVVVGDPDQSIYAFRGAEARGSLISRICSAPRAASRLRCSPSASPVVLGRTYWRPAATSQTGWA